MEGVKRKCMRMWGYNLLPKSNHKRTKTKVVPRGCLCVYVGDQRQRFVVKIELVNHPLFQSLLEDAESEYGFGSDGPIWLPCDADFFCEALNQMESHRHHHSVLNSLLLSRCSDKHSWVYQILTIPRALVLKRNQL